MSETTHIAWTDSTWNPWRGCTKVSAGCVNCYAEKLVTGRLGGKWGEGAPRVKSVDRTFYAPVRWNKKPWVCDACGQYYSIEHGAIWCACPHCMDAPWLAKLHRRRVFLGSLMDWLDPNAPVEWLKETLEVVRQCGRLNFLMLTKRPERWHETLRLVANWYGERGQAHAGNLAWAWVVDWIGGKAPSNIWFGVSVEDQKRADQRVPILLTIPAKVRFVSVEPLLENVDLTRAGQERQNALTGTFQGKIGDARIEWVIVGGESGPNRRDCGVDAILSVKEQCKAANVPCFVKQDCSAKPGQQGRIPDSVWSVKMFPHTSG